MQGSKGDREAQLPAEARRRRSAPTLVRLGLAALLGLGCPALNALFAARGTAFFPAYRSFAKAVASALAALFSPLPVALWDIAALAAIVAAAVVCLRRVRRREPVLPVLSWAVLAVAASAFLFCAWALNHYAPPLAGEISLEVREYSVDELEEACEAYLERAAQLAPELPRDGEGHLVRQDFFELARIAGASYGPLAERWELFEGSSAPVKALLVYGPVLLYSGHTGIYWPATAESGLPLDDAVSELPFTMCHEAAHRLAIASEREANFAAYLACEASDDVRFAYSGAYSAFGYCYGALYRSAPDRAQALAERALEGEDARGAALVFLDRADTREHYDAYEGPFEEVGQTVNDSYLKSFGEQAGVQSYGLVVDYLIAWHQQGLATMDADPRP